MLGVDGRLSVAFAVLYFVGFVRDGELESGGVCLCRDLFVYLQLGSLLLCYCGIVLLCYCGIVVLWYCGIFWGRAILLLLNYGYIKILLLWGLIGVQ